MFKKDELNATEAAKYLRVSLPTLRKIEAEGKLSPRRNRKGRRWYTYQDLNEYLEKSRG